MYCFLRWGPDVKMLLFELEPVWTKTSCYSLGVVQMGLRKGGGAPKRGVENKTPECSEHVRIELVINKRREEKARC